MIYRVFLDTNVYDAANYSFHNAQFSRLSSLAAMGQLCVVINSVIEGEVRSHINDRIKKSVKALKTATQDPSFAGFRNAAGFKDKLMIDDAKEWIDFAQNEFSEFLSACAVRRIPLNGIDMESVMNDYFQQNLPFEQKKPEEFKDAIAIKSLVVDMQEAWNDEPDIIQYCVISGDKGFTSAVKAAIRDTEIVDYTLIFSELIEFTDYLAEMDKQMQFMLRYLKSSYGEDLLHDSVKEALAASSYEIDSDNEVTDQEIVDIDIVSIEPHAVSITNTAMVPDILDTVIEGSANISIDYSFNDENQSFYDKETRTYLYLVSKRIAATYRLKFNIPMSFVVDECLATEEELEDEDEEVFASKDMSLDVYTEQSFELTEDNRTAYEEIETSDDGSYDICPDCGRRIGIENDGGNGFCIDCAANH